MLRAIWWPRKTEIRKTDYVSHGDALNQKELKSLDPENNKCERQHSTLLGQVNWNKPMDDAMNRMNPGSPEPQVSERSRSSVPEVRGPAAYELPGTASRRSANEILQSNPDLGSSRLSHPEEESFALPQQSVSTAPRMIQQSSNGRSGSQNAFKRLKSMGSIIDNAERLPALPGPGDLGPYGYPVTKAGQKKSKAHYPGYPAYRATKCACCLGTFIFIALLACAITTFILAIVYADEGCHILAVLIIMLNFIMVIILILEWVRRWLWKEPTSPSDSKAKMRAAAEVSMGSTNMGGGLPVIATTPGRLANPSYNALSENSGRSGGFLSYSFPPRLYDVPQFISALGLIVLYVIGTLLIVGTLAAATSKMEKCEVLGVGGIAYSSVLAILLCTRVVMCCMSDACRGVCHQMKAKAPDSVPIVAENQLHQFLPGMGGYWHTGGDGSTASGGQPTAWLVNLAGTTDPRQQLSMIRPMPAQYSHDLNN